MSGKIIYPGTFDPITNGHVDLVERASRLFSQVIVAIGTNPQKHTLFSLTEREAIVHKVLGKYQNVEVCTFSGLLINLARDKKITMILRSFRAMSDFDYELQLASVNRIMDPEVETVFLTPSEKYAYVSSSMVREIVSVGGDVSLFVPPEVQRALKNKLEV
ncbi:MAG: Phosphopantetheine adenylyltransferase [uncultured bacterium]|nr:MAG: Phosphopantetheine adenylyltransferase [uncultured bacterium]